MIKKLLLIAVLAIATTSAMAQGMRGGFGGMMYSTAGLMRRDDVKTDLQLTDDQKNKIAALNDDMRSKMREAFQNSGGDREAAMKTMGELMTKANDQVLKILTPDQQKRLKEIRYQLQGYSVVRTDKELQTELGLTDDQKSKIEAIGKEADAANASVGEKMRNQEIQRDEAMASYKKNTDALNSEIEADLTADQKTKFTTLEGKHFDAQPQTGFGGRG
jgi:Spy/CpxP family protein refolding chaperone